MTEIESELPDLHRYSQNLLIRQAPGIKLKAGHLYISVHRKMTCVYLFGVYSYSLSILSLHPCEQMEGNINFRFMTNISSRAKVCG